MRKKKSRNIIWNIAGTIILINRQAFVNIKVNIKFDSFINFIMIVSQKQLIKQPDKSQKIRLYIILVLNFCKHAHLSKYKLVISKIFLNFCDNKNDERPS